MLECELIDFVLSFQSQDLIVCVLAEPLPVVSLLIDFFNLFDTLSDFTLEPFVHPLLISKLFAPHINLVPQRLVLRLELIELGQRLLALVLEQFNFVLVLAHLRGGGSNDFDQLPLFSQLLS